jgi:hypothetical protein
MDSFSYLATYRSFSQNTRKMNLQSILKKDSPPAHIKLEFDMFDVSTKFVKYVVHLPKKLKIKNSFSSHRVSK